MPSIDWSWVLPILVLWTAAAAGVCGLVYLAGTYLENRDQRESDRRPVAPLVELDLHRTRHQRAAHSERRRGGVA